MTPRGEGSLAAAEEHGPKALVENAVKAEEAGFDFVASSDHFHPWLDSQGHAPFAWTVLGAVAARTSRIGIATGVTCPILRYHPAVAQAAATVALLSDGRFTLQLGAGERLNEHVVGLGWPAVSTRHAMLREAIEIIRALWEGGMQTYEAATETVRDEDMAELVGYGPDPERHVEVVKQFVDAGFDHVCLVGIGPDQDAFLRFWSDELQPRLRDL